MKHFFKVILAIAILFLAASILLENLAPYNPWKRFEPYQPPGNTHWLGTNDMGHDILSELMVGSKVSLMVGLISALVSSAIGLARPKNHQQYGYISEHHAFGETMKKSADFAEDLAATMLASTLGVELDPDVAWHERTQAYQVGQRVVVTRSIAQSAKGHKARVVIYQATCQSRMFKRW